MNRSLKNTAAVLLATAMTALAIFGGVQLATVVAGAGATTAGATTTTQGVATASDVAQSSTTVLTCPRTGCTASTCHAVTGRPPGQ